MATKAVQLQGGGRGAGTDPAEVPQGRSPRSSPGVGRSSWPRRPIASPPDEGTGLAVEGLADVTAALRDGAVER